ncbi:hypothetical protein ASD34_06460 [Variovorax sp. Root473]|nr:hypothetical protein ASD34_06460 [Variovorax sp. Root473]
MSPLEWPRPSAMSRSSRPPPSGSVISRSKTVVGKVRPGISSTPANRRGKRSTSDSKSAWPRVRIQSSVPWLAMISCTSSKALAPITRTAW